MTVFSQNCRGDFSVAAKRRDLFQYCRSKYSSYTNMSRGCMLLINNNFELKVKKVKTDKNGNFIILNNYPAAGHIMTRNLKIISDSRIRYKVSKGPKYRFPSRIDFKKCREEIASTLNDFGNRWCKREYVEPNSLKEWK